MEYSTAREEYLKRIEMRSKMIGLTLTIAGVFLGVALAKEGSPTVALMYPPIAAFLSLEWYQIDIRIERVADYIYSEFESPYPDLGLGLNRHMYKIREKEIEKKPLTNLRSYALSHVGATVFTQFMAIFIGTLNKGSDVGNWNFIQLNPIINFLIFIDICCIFVTLFVLKKRMYYLSCIT